MAKNKFPTFKSPVRPELAKGSCDSTSPARTDVRMLFSAIS